MRPTIRPRRLVEIAAAYEEWREPGFPVWFEGRAETLQCRDQDKANWLYLQSKCQRVSDAGYGDAPITEPGIRCTSNNFILPTVDETLAILDALGTWSEAGLANWWRLKDLATSAQSDDELRAIDLTQGWP